MNKNLQDIDHLFLWGLKDYKEDPPENTWQQIDNDLNRKDAENYKAKYRSLCRTLSCLILVCMFFFLGDVLQFAFHFSGRNGSSIPSSNKSISKTGERSITTLKQQQANKSLRAIPTYLLKTTNKISKAEYSDDIFLHNNSISFDADNILISSLPQAVAINSEGGNYFPFISPGSLTKNAAVNNFNLQNQSAALKLDKKEHRFSIAPFFSVDHISARLQEQYEYDDQDESDFTKREKPDMSYTLGLLSEYKLSNYLSLQSGFSLSNTFTSISSTVVRALQDNSGSYKFKLATTYGLAEITKAGIPRNGDSIVLKDASLHVQYISVPVLLKVNLKQGKLNINSSTGIGINRITGDKAEIEYATPTVSEYETVQKIEGLKNTFYTFIAGAEANYSINKRIGAGINPVVRYAITPVNKGTPIKTYPISVGVAATLRVKL
ncbi:MAG TPA: hypothetical protein VH396_09195 [Chitinophagaceae bacterium]|jgi:hypothetical protein